MTEKTRPKRASEDLDKLEAQVKSGAISLTLALTRAFVHGAAFQEESQRILEEHLDG